LPEQAYFFVQSDIISVKMIQYLETIVNCRVLVEGYQQSEEKSEGLVQMVLAKNSGFSYLEVHLNKENNMIIDRDIVLC
jgi:hypothetical protein